MKDCNGSNGNSRNVVEPAGKCDSGHVLTVIEAIKDYVHHKNMVLHLSGLMYKMKHNLINTFHFKYDICHHASSFI